MEESNHNEDVIAEGDFVADPRGAEDLAAMNAEAESTQYIENSDATPPDTPVAEGEANALVPLGEALQELVQSVRSKNALQQAGDSKALSQVRTPPNALEAERALLGGLLLNAESIESVFEEGLRQDDFYRSAHGIVYTIIRELYDSGEPVDTLTVVDALRTKGQLENVGGAASVAELESLVPTSAHVGAYARMIREKSTLRQLINTATHIVQASYQQNHLVSDLVDEAERSILAISESKQRKGVIPMRELVKRAIAQLEQAYEAKSAVTGIPSGFRDFDHKTSGLQPGDLIIIAARPSMGKTAFTLNMASHIALRSEFPVAVFSLEMGAEQLVQRLLGAEGRVDLSRLRKGQIKNTEWSDLARAAGQLSEAPLYIDESPSLSIAEMRTKARRYVHDFGVRAIMVDYLQLMTGPPGMDNKATEVGEISRGLKSIARELKVPMIALSQLNRSVESRTDKRPMMSDLRESGAIEQDADLICFLYREEYYLKDKTPEDKVGVAELIIGKHRNGPTGIVELKFLSELTRFENLDRNYQDYAP